MLFFNSKDHLYDILAERVSKVVCVDTTGPRPTNMVSLCESLNLLFQFDPQNNEVYIFVEKLHELSPLERRCVHVTIEQNSVELKINRTGHEAADGEIGYLHHQLAAQRVLGLAHRTIEKVLCLSSEIEVSSSFSYYQDKDSVLAAVCCFYNLTESIIQRARDIHNNIGGGAMRIQFA